MPTQKKSHTFNSLQNPSNKTSATGQKETSIPNTPQYWKREYLLQLLNIRKLSNTLKELTKKSTPLEFCLQVD